MISISRRWQRCGRIHQSYQLLIMEAPQSSPIMILHTSSTDMSRKPSSGDKVPSTIQQYFLNMKIKIVSVYDKYGASRFRHDFDHMKLKMKAMQPPKKIPSNIERAFEDMQSEIGYMRKKKAQLFRKELEHNTKKSDFGKKYEKVKTKATGWYERITPTSIQKLLMQIMLGTNKEVENGQICWRLRNSPNLRQHATYHEMLALHEFQRDSTKSIVACSIAMLPFGLSLALAVPIFINPRKLLPRGFWTPRQRMEFYGVNHMERIESHREVVDNIKFHTTNKELDGYTRSILAHFCGVFQKQGCLKNKELLALRPTCRDHPFNLKDTDHIALVRAFCKIFEVNGAGSVYKLSGRLRRKAVAIMQMDFRLQQMSLVQLTPQEVMDANYLRGVNSSLLSPEANLYWLNNWLLLSSECTKDDAWFILYALVIHSFYYTEVKYNLGEFS